MKISVTTTNGFKTFISVVDYFSQKVFGNGWEGDSFFRDFAEYVDSTKFPCDKIVLDAFYGYANEFAMTFKYNNEKVCWARFKSNKTKIIEMVCQCFEESAIERMFKNVITDFLKQYNKKVFERQMQQCGFKTLSVKVVVEDYDDYKPNGRTETLEGVLADVFDRYTTHNDRLRYCNGDFWRFKDKNVSTLYTMFVEMYDGNYFLDNAVKRGVTID